MFEQWCSKTADNPPVLVLGAEGKRVPEELYGLLSALLIRSDDMGEDIASVLEQLGFPLPDRPYHVLLAAVDDPALGQLRGGDRHYCQVNMYAAMRRSMAGQLAGRAQGFLLLIFGFLVGILYPDAGDNVMEEAAREAVRYAREEIGVSCHVSVSTAWQGPTQVQRATRMVQDLERSRRFYAGQIDRVFLETEESFRRITDKEQQTRFEQNFFTTASRVCGMVRAADKEAVARELEDQLRRIAVNSIGLPYPNTLNLTVNRFISLMQYRLREEELADWRYLEALDFSRDLISCPTMEEYLAFSRTMADRIVEHARSRLETKHAATMREIRTFLEENATDINIGLTAVARKFHMSPREAAESFRQFYGVSINDVIHQTRVRLAKELLLTTNESVQNIATEVGYCSLATMYRAFTNIEGVAPGRLRQNRSGQEKKGENP